MNATYPEVPGVKTHETETSQQAANSIKPTAATLRDKCYAALKGAAMTSDEVAENLSMSILAIRPRISELNAMRKIEATVFRRKNASGKKAVVWCAVQTATQGDLL